MTKRVDSFNFFLKRMIYILCFTGLCLIDQTIGSATGWIQFGIKNYTSFIIAIIVISAFKIRDFIKIPYFIWLILFFLGRNYVLTWGISNSGNFLKLQTAMWCLGIYGVVFLRLFYFYVIEKKRPHIKWSSFGICLIMLLGMAVIQNDINWPKTLFVTLICLYLTAFNEKDLSNLYEGIADGIILGFFVVQIQAWMYRPYDIFRYRGMYSHPNMNALFYLCAYSAVLCKWYLLKIRKQHVLYRIPLILLAGLIVGTIFFTGARTAYITIAFLTLGFLIFQFFSHEKGKILELALSIVALISSIFICFLPAYYLIRYIPAYVDEPIYFEADNVSKKIKKGEPVDSEKYISLEKALKVMYGRFFGFVDEEKGENTSWIDWKDILMPAQVVYASEMSERYEQYINPIETGYVELGTESSHPLLTGDEENSSVKTRVAIYKYFLERTSIIGKKNNPQGVWVSSKTFATHCHNVLIQISYDFGMIIGVFFVVVIFMFYYKVFKGLREYSEIDDFYRLFVSCSYVSLFLVFGMLDIVWIYGQLPFTMFWLVQYIVYHKQPHEIEAEQEYRDEDDAYFLTTSSGVVIEDGLEIIDMDED